MVKTFISHASEDDELVDYIVEKLENEDIGLDIFVDHKKNMIGCNPQIMIDEIIISPIFIPIISKSSISKIFINNEIKTALSTATVKIFPIIFEIEEVSIPEWMKISFREKDKVEGVLGVDFSNEMERERKYRELVQAIHDYLIDSELLQDTNFLQDVEHIDKIITRSEPTPAEIKIIVDVFLKKEKYANYIFKKLDNLKWLKHLYIYGAFKNNPKPINLPSKKGETKTPIWSALSYLENISKNITEETEERYCNIIIDIVRFHTISDERVENHLSDWKFVKIISNLPQKYIKLGDIKAFCIYLNTPGEKSLLLSEISDSLFPKLIELEEKEKALELLKIFIRNGWDKSNSMPIMENYWLNELIEKNKSDICKLIPLEAAQITVHQIEKIVSKEKLKFCDIAAIEDHPQNLFPEDYENVLVRFLRDCILYAINTNPEDAEKFTMELIKKEHPIFKRIAIYVASNHWPHYSKYFDEFVAKDFFSDCYIEHELYELLKNNFGQFSEGQKLDTILWIETCNYLPDTVDPTEKEVSLAFIKQKWLTAIKDSGWSQAKEKYEHYKNITKSELEHPSFSYYSYGLQVGSISPLNEEELIEMSNKELVDYFNQYKDQGQRFRNPSKKGLKDALSKCIRKYPEKFTNDLDVFLEAKPEYQYHILMGFTQAWNDKKSFDWGPLLIFCEQIIDKDDFWNYTVDNDCRELIIYQISNLIIEGTKDDSNAYDEVHLPITEQIILNLITNLPNGSSKIQDCDLSIHVLNSAKGRTLLAAIYYSLRCARLNKDDSSASRLPIKIKEEFSKRLDRHFDDSLEFSYVLGNCLPYLNYLDEQWVKENINAIFPLEHEKHWIAAMEGHLIENEFDENIFCLMKTNDHYLKAIQTEFLDERPNKRIVKYACISYLHNIEKDSDPKHLFKTLTSKWNPKDIAEIIGFFRRFKNDEELSLEQKEKIRFFWKSVFDHYYDKTDLSDADKKILAESCELAFVLDNIDQNAFEWLSSSIECMNDDMYSRFVELRFVEYLVRLVETSPKEVGLIFLKILEQDIFPHYKKESVISIIEGLYKNDQKSLATNISNLYVENGFEFPRKIYEKYTI